MDELSALPQTLARLQQQTHQDFQVWICVNQPEAWWHEATHFAVCERNRALLQYLHNYQGLRLTILDRSSQGQGWQGKRQGVGWARKTLFDTILQEAAADDLIVSLDADTCVRPPYLASLLHSFSLHPEWPALAVPYYHPLSGNNLMDRAMLRYEIYMRNYAINMLLTDTLYQYTALGSAIVMRAGALQKIGGITPYQSGEDFYLLQKFCKMSSIGHTNDEMVYPATRLSDRVPFGTGPAIQKGMTEENNSYTVFHHSLWDAVRETAGMLQLLYEKPLQTPFLDFLDAHSSNPDPWVPIRRNAKDLPHFIHAYHEKADGLRILQFIRGQHAASPLPDEQALWENMQQWMPERVPDWFSKETRFSDLSVTQMNRLRNLLLVCERNLYKQKTHH